VRDVTWGGLLLNCHSHQPTAALSPTSSAIVCVSSTIVAIGGGPIARDEFLVARRSGVRCVFYAADMPHDAHSPDADYRGALQKAIDEEKRWRTLKFGVGNTKPYLQAAAVDNLFSYTM
jgi:hypothetical protein